MSQSTPQSAEEQDESGGTAPPGESSQSSNGGQGSKTAAKPDGHDGAGHDEAGHDGPEHDPIHDHYPFLAHHFDSPQAQFDAGKLGIWLFLVTEVLFFAGLFCAYTVYRAQHPQVFVYAHYHLDTTW